MLKKKKKNGIKIKKLLKSSANKPAIFLDRDGTINYDYGYTYKFSEFKFRPYILKGLQYLSRKRYLIFIVTNQSGIAKGKFRLSDLRKLHKQLKTYLIKKKIYINEIQYCPYHPKGIIKTFRKRTAYRKPGNLMIKKILNNWNVDLKKSFMIGNRITDKLAAKKSNLYYEHVSYNFYDQIKKIEKKISNNY